MNHPIFKISLPEYSIDKKPDYETIGKKIDQVLIDNFLGQNIAIRCLSLQDHPGMSVEQLIEIIETTGTDKYDPQRKMTVAHNFYSEKGIETFATPVQVTENMKQMNDIIKDFYEGALYDRGYSLKIDLIVIYDISHLEVIPIKYDDGIGRESFKFKNPEKKQSAVLGFIKII